MKKHIAASVLLAAVLILNGCTRSPSESSVPTTVPVMAEPVETTIPPETTEPAPQNDFGPDFQGMDITQLQYWFYDFSRA